MARLSKRRIAVHEAGHAVIGRVLGLVGGGSATIVQNESEGEAGHAILGDPHATAHQWESEAWAFIERGQRPPRFRPVRAAWHGRIIAVMAGAEAEAVLLGQSCEGDGFDLRQIEIGAESQYAFDSDDEWQRYEPRMRRQTRRLIRKHRDKIERVAKALAKRGTLASDEIDALLEAPVG